MSPALGLTRKHGAVKGQPSLKNCINKEGYGLPLALEDSAETIS
jgi:hypothetical protein